MMKQLRESTKVVMIVVAIAFVGLMVFEWGMDYSGQSGRAGAATALGSVNGAEISIEEYQRQYQILYDQAQQRAPDGALTPEQVADIERQAWEDVVDLTLLRREADRRRIRLSDTELVEYIKYNPPQEIIRLPAFQTEGRFDLKKYQQALADPTLAATWRDYETQLRLTLPIQKLEEQVVAGVTVTDADLREAFRDREEEARIAYLQLDPDRLVSAADVRVTDEEVRAYYDAHRADYHRNPSARIRTVVFEPAMTAADSAAVRVLADSLTALARQPDTDFAELAREVSDDELTAGAGGELGWFSLASMDPAFAAAVQTLEPGQVSDPVRTDMGWHVIKLEERQQRDQETEHRARHILIALEATPAARAAARQAAQSFARQASEDGPAAFSDAAATAGLSVIESPLFEQGLVVPGIGAAPAISEFAFSNEAGAVSGPLEHQGRFAVVRVDERYPEGTVAFGQLQDRIRQALVAVKQREALREMAPHITAVVQQEGLEGAAQRYGLEVRTTGLFTRTNNIPGIGSGTPVAGAAFGLAQGQTAGPIEGPGGLYYLRLIEKRPFDPQTFESSRTTLRDQLRGEKARAWFEAWFEDLREQAEIEDNRSQLLGT